MADRGKIGRMVGPFVTMKISISLPEGTKCEVGIGAGVFCDSTNNQDKRSKLKDKELCLSSRDCKHY